jgi:hypothetical protein
MSFIGSSFTETGLSITGSFGPPTQALRTSGFCPRCVNPIDLDEEGEGTEADGTSGEGTGNDFALDDAEAWRWGDGGAVRERWKGGASEGLFEVLLELERELANSIVGVWRAWKVVKAWERSSN